MVLLGECQEIFLVDESFPMNPIRDLISLWEHVFLCQERDLIDFLPTTEILSDIKLRLGQMILRDSDLLEVIKQRGKINFYLYSGMLESTPQVEHGDYGWCIVKLPLKLDSGESVIAECQDYQLVDELGKLIPGSSVRVWGNGEKSGSTIEVKHIAVISNENNKPSLNP